MKKCQVISGERIYDGSKRIQQQKFQVGVGNYKFLLFCTEVGPCRKLNRSFVC